jgi:hypothetical protein
MDNYPPTPFYEKSQLLAKIGRISYNLIANASHQRRNYNLDDNSRKRLFILSIIRDNSLKLISMRGEKLSLPPDDFRLEYLILLIQPH